MGLDRHQLELALRSIQFSSNPMSNNRRDNLPLKLSVHTFETVTSTNRTVWELIDQGAGAGTVAIASQQQAGRGQWGRQWQSSPGGLYLSLALEPNLPVENNAQLTLCSAWGIATTLRHYGIPVLLKWLNDLVIDGRKLGGILTETRIQGEVITKAVVGVGINWTNPVPDTGVNLKTVLLTCSGSPIGSLEVLAAVVLQGLITGYQSWQQQGIEVLLPAYQELLTSIGRTVTVENQVGVVTGISSNGNLRVRFEDSAHSLASKEIFLEPGAVSLGYT